MWEHEKELEMVADEWRDEVGEARAQVEELKDVSFLCCFLCTVVYIDSRRIRKIREIRRQGERRAIRHRSRIAAEKNRSRDRTWDRGDKHEGKNNQTDIRYSRVASKTSRNSAKPSSTARKN